MVGSSGDREIRPRDSIVETIAIVATPWWRCGAAGSIVPEAKGGLGIFIFQNFHCESVSGPRVDTNGAAAACSVRESIENRPWTAMSSTVVR